MAFSWLTYGQAKAELASRLNDPTFTQWSSVECGVYLVQAMRFWNCLTAYTVADYSLDLTPPFTGNWFQANGSGSPRQPTLTDIDVYTMMQYMLLEPPSGGVWTGTTQFNIAGFAQALQGSRDETLQAAATNMQEIGIPITPGTSRVNLPDNVLDVLRVRYVPAPSQGPAVMLQRGDGESFRVFTPNYLQTYASPLRWDVITGPPLALTVDTLVNVPANLQVLAMIAEPVPNPPAATPLGMPDDWSFVPMFGALADLLSEQEESRDIQRAEYCRMRYMDGMDLLKNAPWLMESRINNVAVATSSVVASDRFNYEWQSNPSAFPEIVVGGIDLYAVSPVPSYTVAKQVSVVLTLVGNAPIPANDAAFIQVPRDVMDAMLDYAEHMALFKRGGPEFMQSMALYQSFLKTASRWNARIRASGLFSSTLRAQAQRDEAQKPRLDSMKKE